MNREAFNPQHALKKGNTMTTRIMFHAACIVKRPATWLFHVAGILREFGICL